MSISAICTENRAIKQKLRVVSERVWLVQIQQTSKLWSKNNAHSFNPPACSTSVTMLLLSITVHNNNIQHYLEHSQIYQEDITETLTKWKHRFIITRDWPHSFWMKNDEIMKFSIKMKFTLLDEIWTKMANWSHRRRFCWAWGAWAVSIFLPHPATYLTQMSLICMKNSHFTDFHVIECIFVRQNREQLRIRHGPRWQWGAYNAPRTIYSINTFANQLLWLMAKKMANAGFANIGIA